jgi:hypothetical protein
MTHRRHAATALLGWALLYSRYGNDWRVVDQFVVPELCQKVMAAQVEQAAHSEMGALEGAGDNPMSRDAYEHALRRVRGRYRCAGS